MADAKEEVQPPAAKVAPIKDGPMSKADKKQEDMEFNAATTMHVKLYSPFQVYFDDDAESISAENDTGPFDILPRHHNFITLLNPCELEIKSSRGDKKIKISRGVMHVRKNKVTVFLDV